MKTLNWTYLFNWKDVPAVIREFFFYSIHSFIHLFAHSFQASIMLFFLLVPSISSTFSWWVHTSTVATSATLLVLSVAQSTFSQETHTHSHSKLWKSHSLSSSCLFICYVAACCYCSRKGMGGAPTAWVMYLLLSWVYKTNIFTLGEWRKTSVLVIANEFGMGFSR